jgi:hypothetical protein
MVDVPSKPSIESVQIGDDATYIKWHIDDTGDMNLNYAFVELSHNFTDPKYPLTERSIKFFIYNSYICNYII